MFPEVELEPYKVPCGPLRISTRSTSKTCKSGVWPIVVKGCSSKYKAVVEAAPEGFPNPPSETPLI